MVDGFAPALRDTLNCANCVWSTPDRLLTVVPGKTRAAPGLQFRHAVCRLAFAGSVNICERFFPIRRLAIDVRIRPNTAHFATDGRCGLSVASLQRLTNAAGSRISVNECWDQ